MVANRDRVKSNQDSGRNCDGALRDGTAHLSALLANENYAQVHRAIQTYGIELNTAVVVRDCKRCSRITHRRLSK